MKGGRGRRPSQVTAAGGGGGVNEIGKFYLLGVSTVGCCDIIIWHVLYYNNNYYPRIILLSSN